MKPLVLLHGWGMRPAVFDALGARLASRYRIHALPLPGYEGAPGCEPYTLQTLAHALSGAAPDRCVVAGWSLGAQVALAWARAFPDQIERVALIGATPCFTRRESWSNAIAPEVLRGFADALACDRAGTLKRFVSLQAQGELESRTVARALRAGAATQAGADVSTLQRGLDVLLEADLRDVLHAITHEVLVIHGERDALVPLAAGECLAQALPRARLTVIEGAAHAPFVSQVDAVARAMEEFFA